MRGDNSEGVPETRNPIVGILLPCCAWATVPHCTIVAMITISLKTFVITLPFIFDFGLLRISDYNLYFAFCKLPFAIPTGQPHR